MKDLSLLWTQREHNRPFVLILTQQFSSLFFYSFSPSISILAYSPNHIAVTGGILLYEVSFFYFTIAKHLSRLGEGTKQHLATSPSKMENIQQANSTYRNQQMRNTTTNECVEETKKYALKYILVQYTNNSHRTIIGKLIVEVNPIMSCVIEYHCPSKIWNNLSYPIYTWPWTRYLWESNFHLFSIFSQCWTTLCNYSFIFTGINFITSNFNICGFIPSSINIITPNFNILVQLWVLLLYSTISMLEICFLYHECHVWRFTGHYYQQDRLFYQYCQQYLIMGGCCPPIFSTIYYVHTYLHISTYILHL